jgi:hypothetical protein
MNNSLVIKVGDRETHIDYAVGDQMLVHHVHPFGLRHIEDEGMNTVAGSKFLDGIMYALEFISLHDRIPTNFRLITPLYATWIGEVIEGASYTQFYTNGTLPSVTLEGTHDPSLGYARHTQTILSFKV